MPAALTPRLLLDEARLERNIARMAERVRELGGALRPHAKTHKSGEITGDSSRPERSG